jgi:hypothetical protein
MSTQGDKRPTRPDAGTWNVDTLEDGVTRVTFGNSLWVLLSSDWHWDSVKCERDKLKEDLELAKRHKAAVLSIGDLFDVMGGKYDPRSNGKYDVRPEFSRGNYFDDVVSQCADWLQPYGDQLALITPGNHETAVRKRMETCLTTRLVERLRMGGSKVRSGGYAGWVLFRSLAAAKRSAVHKLWYHHGYGGGGGPVTRGVIDFSRYLVDTDADVVHAGHIHQRTLVEATRQRLSANGVARVKPLHLVRSASYKQESLTDGWAVEKGMSSRPLGGWWMRLKWNHDCTELQASFHDAPHDTKATT